jgi:hypothetical protein
MAKVKYYMLQVKLHFLMKGNTHEDVDQLFQQTMLYKQLIKVLKQIT